jgi:hypothetical protein
VARSPLRSIQLTSTPRDDTDSCGWAEPDAAGVEISCGAIVNDVWRATALAVAATTVAVMAVAATAKAIALQTKALQTKALQTKALQTKALQTKALQTKLRRVMGPL